MKKAAELNSKHKFVQSNQVIQASFDRSMTVFGQKLLRLAISQIDSVKDNEFFEYEIKIADFAKLLGLKDSKNIYRDSKKICLSVLKTTIGIEDQRKKNGSYKYYTLFESLEYDDGCGTITFRFSEAMKPFFLHLKQNFTQIPLDDVLMMSHKYSIRVYELIKMKLKDSLPHADEHYIITLSLKELRKATGTEKKYTQIKDFKNRVLIPSLEDIERMETARLHCNVKDIKEGRQIVGFKLDCWSLVGWEYMKRNKDQYPGQMDMFIDYEMREL